MNEAEKIHGEKFMCPGPARTAAGRLILQHNEQFRININGYRHAYVHNGGSYMYKVMKITAARKVIIHIHFHM